MKKKTKRMSLVNMRHIHKCTEVIRKKRRKKCGILNNKWKGVSKAAVKGARIHAHVLSAQRNNANENCTLPLSIFSSELNWFWESIIHESNMHRTKCTAQGTGIKNGRNTTRITNHFNGHSYSRIKRCVFLFAVFVNCFPIEFKFITRFSLHW